MVNEPRLILGSGSPRRLDLLAQLGVRPNDIRPPDIDETPRQGELPRPYCVRMARAKVRAVPAADDDIVLCADTTVALGRRILGKPADAGQAAAVGQPADTLSGVVVAAGVGAVSVAGGYTVVSAGAVSVASAVCTATVAGQAADVEAVTAVAAGTGQIAISGQLAAVVVGAVVMGAGPGSVVMAGMRGAVVAPPTTTIGGDVAQADAAYYDVVISDASDEVTISDTAYFAVVLEDANT